MLDVVYDIAQVRLMSEGCCHVADIEALFVANLVNRSLAFWEQANVVAVSRETGFVSSLITGDGVLEGNSYRSTSAGRGAAPGPPEVARLRGSRRRGGVRRARGRPPGGGGEEPRRPRQRHASDTPEQRARELYCTDRGM